MRNFLLLLLLTLFAYSENIEKYAVDVNIDNSGRVYVTEDISYNFGDINHHGIFRDIPLNNTQIKNVKVLQNGRQTRYSTSTIRDGENRFKRIKIGYPNRYVKGIVNYKISYTIDGYVVRNNGNTNRIIIDLIGTGWKVNIKNIIAKVHLPSSVANSANIKVYRGKFGSKEELEFKKQGSVVVIKTDYLYPHEGITISISFDKLLIKADTKPVNKLHQKFWDNPIYYLFFLPPYTCPI